jgi:diaminopimelate epimerase
VTVHQPGGSLIVELRHDGSAELSGPSVVVASCDYDDLATKVV